MATLAVIASNSEANVGSRGRWLGVAVTRRQGRPSHAQRTSASRLARRRYGRRVARCYLAIDVGGTKLAAGDRRRRRRGRWSATGSPRRRATCGRRSHGSCAGCVAAAPDDAASACGVGCGGPIDPARRDGVAAAHPDAGSASRCAAAVEELTGLPVVVDNDAKALALAEAGAAPAAGVDDFVGVVVGTGVGGGIVAAAGCCTGRLGNAGHIGHIVVEPDGLPCVCGGPAASRPTAVGPAIEAETGRPPQRAPPADRRAHRACWSGGPLASVGGDLRPAPRRRRRLGRRSGSASRSSTPPRPSSTRRGPAARSPQRLPRSCRAGARASGAARRRRRRVGSPAPAATSAPSGRCATGG